MFFVPFVVLSFIRGHPCDSVVDFSLARPIPYPQSEAGLDIKLLKHFFTPEEANIALELSALPEPIARIHKRLKNTGISLDELELILDKMAEKGSILGGKIFESKGQGKLYSKAPLAVGMYEFQAGRLTKELEKDFQGYLNEKYYKVFHILFL